MKKIIVVVVMVLLANFAAAHVYAQDFGTALSRLVSEIPDGADVASMGNANTALTSDYSTRNPGAVDVTEAAARGKGGLSASYANISFQHGPSVNLYILSGAARLPIGTLQVSYSNGGSNNGKLDELGDTLKFNNFPSVEVQYGLKLGSNLLFAGDELFAGVGYGYSESKLTSNTFVEEELMKISSKSISNTLETGLLYRFNRVNLGIMELHSWDKETDTMYGFSESTKSTSDQLRLGVSAKTSAQLSTMISADYRHLFLPDGNKDDQFHIGVEQYLIKDTLAVYGGYANGGWTTGLGFYLPNGGINFAYMHRPFRAAEEFLGKAEVYMVQLYGTF